MNFDTARNNALEYVQLSHDAHLENGVELAPKQFVSIDDSALTYWNSALIMANYLDYSNGGIPIVANDGSLIYVKNADDLMSYAILIMQQILPMRGKFVAARNMLLTATTQEQIDTALTIFKS